MQAAGTVVSCGGQVRILQVGSGLQFRLTDNVVYEAPACKVVLGKEHSSGEKVAVKVLQKPGRGGDEQDLVQAFAEREAFMAMSEHPHVMNLLCAAETPSMHVLVMPYAPDGDLWDLVRYGKTYCEAEVRNCAGQVFAALQHLHETCRLIHHDIKPQNLLLSRVGHRLVVRVADFGLSRKISMPDSLVGFEGLKGTSGWFAPEQLEGRDYGAAIDLFACGLIIFRMLGGYAAFDPPSRAGRGLSFDDDYWGHVTAPCKDLLSRLLALDPSDRGTARAAGEHDWLAGPPPPEPTAAELAGLSRFGPPPASEPRFWPADQVLSCVDQAPEARLTIAEGGGPCGVASAEPAPRGPSAARAEAEADPRKCKPDATGTEVEPEARQAQLTFAAPGTTRSVEADAADPRKCKPEMMPAASEAEVRRRSRPWNSV